MHQLIVHVKQCSALAVMWLPNNPDLNLVDYRICRVMQDTAATDTEVDEHVGWLPAECSRQSK